MPNLVRLGYRKSHAKWIRYKEQGRTPSAAPHNAATCKHLSETAQVLTDWMAPRSSGLLLSRAVEPLHEPIQSGHRHKD